MEVGNDSEDTQRKKEMCREGRWREARKDVESQESPGRISIPGQHWILTAAQSLSTAKPALTKLDRCAPQRKHSGFVCVSCTVRV